MKFSDAFLILNLALVTISIAAHDVASETYFLLVIHAAVCVAAWRVHRGRSKFRLSETVATWICLLALAFALFRGISSSSFRALRLLDVRVSSVGQFLSIFQWVYLLKEKKPRDYAWSYLVTAVHMGTAALQMPGIGFAFFFVLYATTGVATLTAYTIWVELQSVGADLSASTFRLGKGFLLRAALTTIALMVPVSALFIALPRRPESATVAFQLVRIPGVAPQPIMGFSDTVSLGQIGTIQENPNRVMQVKTFDPDTGETVHVPGLLLRGVALDTYEYSDGRWLWRRRAQRGDWLQSSDREAHLNSIYQASFPQFDRPPYRRIRCEILLEPLRTETLFAPFAPETVKLPSRYYLSVNWRLHHMAYRTRQRGSLDYEVTSRIYDLAAPSLNDRDTTSESPATLMNRYLADYLMLPARLSPRVTELAREIAPEAECPDDYAKAIRIRDYLSDQERFTYTVKQEPTPGVEPVEDFLFNLKRGHCEYFASSMVVLLRSVGVPARVVNGFKMNEWNPIAGNYVVRQSHAHSWAEAYIHPLGWRTLDASVMRDSATPQPVFARRWYRHIFDTAETFWVQRILNYTADEQQEIFTPVRGVFAALQSRLSRTFSFVDNLRLLPSGNTARRGVIAIIAAMLVGAAAFTARMLWSREGLFAARRRRRGDPALRAFDEMERLLAKRGFPRDPSQTAQEYRDALAAATWPDPASLSCIVGAFCNVRYGGAELSDSQVKAVHNALSAIRHHASRFPSKDSSRSARKAF